MAAAGGRTGEMREMMSEALNIPTDFSSSVCTPATLTGTAVPASTATVENSCRISACSSWLMAVNFVISPVTASNSWSSMCFMMLAAFSGLSIKSKAASFCTLVILE